MKKMTNKEFKEVLKKADVDFETFGYEGILNMLSIFFDRESAYAMKQGCELVARHERERADIIFDELNNRNYYERR